MARRGPQHWNKQEEIAEPLFVGGASVAQVRIQIREQEQEVPPDRTLYNWKKKYRPRLREIWQRQDATPEEAALLLPVLAEVALATGGRVHDLSKGEAAALLSFLRLAPDLDPVELYVLAGEYSRRPAGQTADIDMFLAIAPWRGPSWEGWQRYNRLERLGVVPADSMVRRIGEHAETIRAYWQHEGQRKETES